VGSRATDCQQEMKKENAKLPTALGNRKGAAPTPLIQSHPCEPEFRHPALRARAEGPDLLLAESTGFVYSRKTNGGGRGWETGKLVGSAPSENSHLPLSERKGVKRNRGGGRYGHPCYAVGVPKESERNTRRRKRTGSGERGNKRSDMGGLSTNKLLEKRRKR